MNYDFFSKILNTEVGVTIKEQRFNDEGDLISDLKMDDIVSFYIKGGTIDLNIISSLKNYRQTFISILIEIENNVILQGIGNE